MFLGSKGEDKRYWKKW